MTTDEMQSHLKTNLDKRMLLCLIANEVAVLTESFYRFDKEEISQAVARLVCAVVLVHKFEELSIGIWGGSDFTQKFGDKQWPTPLMAIVNSSMRFMGMFSTKYPISVCKLGGYSKSIILSAAQIASEIGIDLDKKIRSLDGDDLCFRQRANT